MKIEHKIKINPQAGFTLVETLVSLTIVVTILLAVYGLVLQSLKLTQENKLKLSATILSNQKIEQIRNLPYNSIGTVSGIPNGAIPNNETVTDSRGSFSINTIVQYIDDSFDGVAGGSPDDLLPADYKLARVRVGWNGPFGFNSVTASTYISPRGLEADPGGGVLVVTILNASGQPVESADVTIKNTSLSPAVNFNIQTNAAGTVIIPGAPESIEGYEIIATKTGHSMSSTSARTVANPNPSLVNATVLTDQTTNISLAIDILSTLNIQTINQALPANWMANNDGGTEDQTMPTMAIDNSGNYYVVWQDYRHGSASKIYAQKYNAAGDKQWDAGDKLIGSANGQILPKILIDNANNAVYFTWSDDQGGNFDCYIVKLATSDGADLWGGSKKVDYNSANKDQINPAIALAPNGDIAIVWEDDRDGNSDIYLMRYTSDKAVRWNESKINLDAGSADQTDPIVKINSNDKAFVSWTDTRNTDKDIYLARIESDGTRDWASDLKVNSLANSTNQYESDMIFDSNDILYLVWTDGRNGAPDIYATSLDATGTPMWASELRVNSDTPTTTNQTVPSLTINPTNNNIYIAWSDERWNNQDIYAQKINTSGTKFWTEDYRVNVNGGGSNQTNPSLTFNPSTGKPVATWQDYRNVNADVYASEFDGSGISTSVGGISYIVTGAKKIGENPIIYKFSNTYTSDSNGLIHLPNMEWDSYTIEPTATTRTILMSNPPAPMNLSPNSSSTILIYLSN